MNLDSYAIISHKPLGDNGEDAFAYNFKRQDIQSFGVFDGCGGAGAWKYPEYNNATGAFIAAQSISKAFREWVELLSPEDNMDPNQLAIRFHDISLKKLAALKQCCAPMGVSGSLVKSFPCTASVAILTQDLTGNLRLSALNVGDSRIYIALPNEGLIQITKDDSRGNPDPLKSLRDNPPLSDLLNADKAYKVKARQIAIQMPCAVMCATDGVFGFVRSPMDFEYLLLHAVESASTISEFEANFRSSILKITGDDSTCIMAFYGFGNYQEIKKTFKNRFDMITEIIQKINRAHDPSDAERIVQEEWESYKKKTVYDEMKV